MVTMTTTSDPPEKKVMFHSTTAGYKNGKDENKDKECEDENTPNKLVYKKVSRIFKLGIGIQNKFLS